MGDKSEILDSLSKWSTSTVLAVALVAMMWMNSHDDRQWDERLAGIMERQADSQERQEANAKALADALTKILEKSE